jgi:3-hydroxymyristoyl/3-hydroxydecanoyl-(acyl carrier protein) dehydratase
VVELRPDILATRPSPTGVRFDLRVPADLSCFRDHFPGFPLLPGVVQLDWALALARPQFSLPPRFTHIADLKFMHPVPPGEPVELDLSFDDARSEVRFCFRDRAGRECSSGRIGFKPDSADV